MKEFGCDEILYVRFERPPPRRRGFLPNHHVLEDWVIAFPEEARLVLKLLDEQATLEAEGKLWWG